MTFLIIPNGLLQYQMPLFLCLRLLATLANILLPNLEQRSIWFFVIYVGYL